MKKLDKILKVSQYVVLVVCLSVLTFLTNCDTEYEIKSPQDELYKLLTANPWELAEVTLQNVDQMKNWGGMTLLMRGDYTYITTNVQFAYANVWTNTGEWAFSDRTTTDKIVIDDLQFASFSVTASTLYIAMTVYNPSGRSLKSDENSWAFKFIKKPE